MPQKQFKRLTARIVFTCVLVTALIGLVLSGTGFFICYSHAVNAVKSDANSIIQITARTISSEAVQKVLAQPQDGDTGRTLQTYMNEVRNTRGLDSASLLFFPNEGNSAKISCLVNAYTIAELSRGDLMAYGQDCTSRYTPAILKDLWMALYRSGDKRATHYLDYSVADPVLTAYLPVTDANGKGLCILLMTFPSTPVRSLLWNYSLTAGMVVLVSMLLVLLVAYRTARRKFEVPVTNAAQNLDRFSEQMRQLPSPTELRPCEASSVHGEIGQLTGAVGTVTASVKTYVENMMQRTAAEENRRAELKIEEQIYKCSFPTLFPAFPLRSDFDVYATHKLLAQGRSSFYDFFLVDDDHFCMAIGESSGEGLQSTLFTIAAVSNIRTFGHKGYAPAEIAAQTNTQLLYNNPAGLTVSVIIAVIDLRNGVLSYVNAGQPNPLIKYAGQGYAPLVNPQSLPLGDKQGTRFLQHEINLVQGDTLFLFTNALPETADVNGNVFSEEYLQAVINDTSRQNYELPAVLSSVNTAVEEFRKGAKPTDDNSTLIFRFFGL